MDFDIKHYAYIGDCVWELFIRKLVIQKTKNQKTMHQMSTKYVCASRQAEMLDLIYGCLFEDELEIQKRGRNLKMTINKKNNPQIHSLATSFETIIGYLYLNKKERLQEIFEIIKNNLEELQ